MATTTKKKFDTTGINTANIGKMQNAIDTWAKEIEGKNVKLAVSSKKVAKAVKGANQQAAIKKLCQACDSYAKTLTSQLKVYKGRLTDVKTAYEKNDTSSTAISDVTAQINNLKS